MQSDSYILLTKILFLRQIIRKSANQTQNRLIGKFGFGVFKYEICSNLKKQKDFRELMTVLSCSKCQIIFSLASNCFSYLDKEIDETDSEYTQIEQISKDNLILSGGQMERQKQLTVIGKAKVDNFQMQFRRYYHRTNFNKHNLVFIISGEDECEHQFINVSECEAFNINKRIFSIIQPIQTSASSFGCDGFDSKVYVFGGHNVKESYLQKIQKYDCKRNE